MGRRDKAKDLSPVAVFPPWPYEETPVLLKSLQKASSITDQLKILRESAKNEHDWAWLLLCRFASTTPLQLYRSIDSQWGKRPPSTNTRSIVESVYQSLRLDGSAQNLHAEQEVNTLSEFVTWWIKQKDDSFDVQVILDDLSPVFAMSNGEQSVRLAGIIATVIQSEDVNVPDGIAESLWDILMNHHLTNDLCTTMNLAYAKLNPGFVDRLENVADLDRRMSLVAAYAVTAADIHIQKLQDLSFDVAASASDPEVRVMAWKCLRSILRRSTTVKWEESLNLILSAWEHPPTRALELAIPPVFQIFQVRHPNPKDLIEPILQQPLRSKSRYIALLYLIDYIQEDQKTALSKELVEYLGDFSHTVVAVADLYGKLISTGSFETDLACQLTAPTALSRRQQILAYSLPIIVRRTDAKDSVRLLLQCIQRIPDDGMTKERETANDRIVWGLLEVIRYSEQVILHDDLLQKLVQSILQRDIAEYLLHCSETIRLPAFQCLHIAFYQKDEMWLSIQREEAQWRRALLWNAKTENSEFVSSLFFCLALFLDRMLEQECRSCMVLDSGPLPAFRAFVVDFLLGALVEALGYPGTVVSKERFLLVLLECLIVFSTRDHSLARNSKLIPKTSRLRSRKRSQVEEVAMVEIRKALLRKEVFGALFVLLRSAWDPIRSSAFAIGSSLIELVNGEVRLPAAFRSSSELESAMSRAKKMASSPKPRVADSGARMLALFFRCSSLKGDFLLDNVDRLENCLEKMSQYLRKLVNSNDPTTGYVEELPMAHGIIQTWQLILGDLDSSFPDIGQADKGFHETLDRLLAVLHRALQLSLTVVADVKDGANLEFMTDFEVDATYLEKRAVNPGAIGANGVFSSLKSISEGEKARRCRSQLLVIGSWLLTKESCAALSCLLSLDVYMPDFEMYKRSGDLLLNTLSALKHAGAAFAAHRSLQKIAMSCFRKKSLNRPLGSLPYRWAEWILIEISGSERIRDSTLRRSMGYSLGLLSLMRAEVISDGRGEQSLTQKVLGNLLQSSLPSKQRIRELERRLGVEFIPFIYVAEKDDIGFLDHTSQGVRTRVHALNALRFIILDAPLSQEALPILGISIMSAIIGHFDAEWSIRNSATLLFAAAMQRSIDRDKNGSGADPTATKASRADQLFQSYSPLRGFLIAAFEGCNVSKGYQDTAALPIITVLSRIRAIRHSNPESQNLVEAFFPLLINRLGDHHASTRSVAARALSNLCTEGEGNLISESRLFSFCLHKLQLTENTPWNLFHGCLLMAERLLTQHIPVDTTELEKRLAALATISEDIPFTPLPCIAMALACLSHLPHNCEWFISFFASVKMWLENGSKHRQKLAGYGELGTTLGAILSRQSCKYLCDEVNTLSNEAPPVSCLVSMMCSSNFDVRTCAVKEFKKALPEILERKLHESSQTLFLKGVHSALSRELDQFSQPHIPTIRRLTRCLLDILDTRQLIVNEEFLSSILATAWAIMRMCWKTERPGGITKLHGYSLELVAYLIQAGKHDVLDYPSILTKLDILLHPHNDFRVRYSATIAIRTLWSLPLSKFWTSELFSLWVRSTQDSNCHVRDASSTLRSSSRRCRAKLISEASFQSTLWQGQNYRDMVSAMSQLASAQSICVSDSNQAKVFAEEKINSYEEPTITTELLSLALMTGRFALKRGDVECLERFLGSLETALSESDDSFEHGALGFLFRDLQLSPRLFVLATTVLTFHVLVSERPPLRQPNHIEHFHPTLQKLLLRLRSQGETSPGYYLTTSLQMP